MLNYMPSDTKTVREHSDANRGTLIKMLKALSDPTRLSIFDILMGGTHCNCEIAEQLDLSLSLISHHLRVLREAGLIRSERDPNDARWIYYSVDEEALAQLRAELEHLLDASRIQSRQPSCGLKRCNRR